MISAVCWIPKGVAKAVPQTAELTAEELATVAAAAQALQEADDVDDGGNEDSDEEDEEELQDEVAKARAAAAALLASESAPTTTGVVQSIESAMAELDMDHYDDSDEEGGAVARMLAAGKAEILDDEYINPEDDDDSEADDLAVKTTDLLILATKNEDDVSHLEVWLYEEADSRGDANLFVHHDVLLPAFPLAVSWLDCDPTGRRPVANLAAVGTMEPGIEIWDLAVIDAVEPVVTLGGIATDPPECMLQDGEAANGEKKKKKKKKKKSKKLKPDSHEDAVLGLGWNREFRNVLASCSADTCVKVWDVMTQQCSHTLRYHSDKVQALQWNPAEAPVLLSGGFDKKAFLADVRQPTAAPLCWGVSADVEALCWVPAAPTQFLVSAEDGIVAAFDARAGSDSAPLYRLSAHDKATSALSFSPAAPGLLATGSTDKTVKLWNVSNQSPSLVASQDVKVGAIFSLSFCAEAPWLLAVGGAKGTVIVWDTATNAAVRSAFSRA